jgi:hypothetical protein
LDDLIAGRKKEGQEGNVAAEIIYAGRSAVEMAVV